MAKKALSEGEQPVFPSTFEVTRRVTLNFTNIEDNSNKFYNLELQKASTGETRIYTNYGRVGGTAAKEYRLTDSESHANSEIDKIIKAKVKKGYLEVKLVKADVGSDVAKAKVEADKVLISDLKVVTDVKPSLLHTEVQSLIKTWFAATNTFIELNLDTKKCPLGQLSLEQIAKGRTILDEVQKIIHATPDVAELNRLTNTFFSLIPHNFGGYARIDANVLRLDSDDKINKEFDMLDVLGDSKSIQDVLSSRSNVDNQYASLNANIEYVDPQDPVFGWINKMVLETRANNHSGLGKIKVHKVFKLLRSGEDKFFEKNVEVMSKQNCGYNPSKVYDKLVKNRIDVSQDLFDLYKQANVLPGFHGTRRANMIGVTTKGLLIRPSGVVHAGSMYGDSVYWASNSSKSINYTDVRGSYWAQGSSPTAYLFLADVAFGKQKMAKGAYFHTKENIKPFHSVWAKGGEGGVINDEMMVYNPSGPEQQHILRYIIEFETQVR